MWSGTSRVGLGAWLVLVPLGCGDDTRSCTAQGCDDTLVVSLVTDAGAPATTRGELRFDQAEAAPFNCAPENEAEALRCEGGRLQFSRTEGVFEVRFALGDDAFTDWQVVDLDIQPVTDPDFNGPGCPCTWYEGRPVVVVPDSAMIPTGG